MKNNKIPSHCKGCKALWIKGIKDGKHDRWCCQFGRPAPKAVNHCINTDSKEEQIDSHIKNFD